MTEPFASPSLPVTRTKPAVELIVRSLDPFNAEPPAALLCTDDITPVGRFFVRNHGAVPDVDPAGYAVRVTGAVERDARWSLDDIMRLPKHTLSAALQCAGSRRAELDSVSPVESGVRWKAQAIGTARWGGARLADVLEASGVREEGHAAFVGLDEADVEDGITPFGASIPMSKALAPEVLLAYEMNGEPLSPNHGFPLRVVVPGYIGARSVKWISEIRVQDEPSDNHFQASDYRFRPRLEGGGPEFALAEASLNSAICEPEDEAQVRAGNVRVRGYALVGGGRRIGAVGVSADGRATFRSARIVSDQGPWGWVLWETDVRLPPGRHELAVRAWDSSGATQPRDAAAVWNERGYANTAIHRIEVEAVAGL